MPTKPNTALLNVAFTDARITELGLLRQTVAEQIGVNRNTVRRWLNGQVKWVHMTNLRLLAKVLRCEPEDLILKSDDEVFTTRQEQKEAASLIQNSELVPTLTSSGDFRLLESLLKACLQPNLDPKVLGRLYTQISYSLMNQRKMDESREYAYKAQKIAVETGSAEIRCMANCLLAFLEFSTGDRTRAREMFERNIIDSSGLEDKTCNSRDIFGLGLTQMVLGENDDAERSMHQSIALRSAMEPDKKNQSFLALAWSYLSTLQCKMGKFEEAGKSIRHAARYAETLDFREIIRYARLNEAIVSAFAGEVDTARSQMDEWLNRYSPKNMEDYIKVIAICRKMGEHDMASSFEEKMKEMA